MSAPTPEKSAAPVKAKGGGGMMPVLAVIVLVPALCFATTQFVLVPKLKAAMGASAEGGHEAAAEEGEKKGGEHKAEPKKEAAAKHGKDEKKEKGKGGGSGSYAHSHDFGDVIVNLAGAKGTRYLRAHFSLASGDANLETLVKSNGNQLRDIAIGVLSTQTLESLEQPGARNAVRNELIAQFNHALHGELVEQIYFTEFVVQ